MRRCCAWGQTWLGSPVVGDKDLLPSLGTGTGSVPAQPSLLSFSPLSAVPGAADRLSMPGPAGVLEPGAAVLTTG